ncbi:MAG: hypothetical protein ACRC9L_04530 [Brevinema sp.]
MSKKQFYVICSLLVIIIILLAYSIFQHNDILKMIVNSGDYIGGKLDNISSRVIGIYEFFK